MSMSSKMWKKIDISPDEAQKYICAFLGDSDQISDEFRSVALLFSRRQALISTSDKRPNSLEAGLSCGPGLPFALKEMLGGHITGPATILSWDIWAKPDDIALSMVSNTEVFGIDQMRFVYTRSPLDNLTMLSNHFRSIISFFHITAVTPRGNPIIAAPSDVINLVSNAEFIAVPVFDGDSILVFHD